MTPRQRPKKIDWAMANFMLVFASTIVLAFMAYAYFNGAASSRLDRLESDVSALRAEVREVERRLR